MEVQSPKRDSSKKAKISPETKTSGRLFKYMYFW